MPTHFYIFRHGQCPLNITDHIQGRKFNGNLTDVGKQQAFQTAQKLKNKQISLIVSSPLNRALQTAKIVADIINAPIYVDHRFIEVNMGIVEGMHISTLEKTYPLLYRKWRNEPLSQIKFDGGESKLDVRKRILSGINHYATQTTHHNIGISSHGIAISQIMQYLGKNCSSISNGAILHISHQNNQLIYHDLIN